MSNPNPTPSMVPAVPKVKGIKVKFMFKQAITICQCGNANQHQFIRYFKKYRELEEVDGKMRHIKKEDVFIKCYKCKKTRPMKEHIKDYNEVLAKRR